MLLIVWMMEQKVCKHCMKTKRKRWWTFRKWVVAFIVLITFGGTVTSYVFTGLGIDPNSDVTIEILKIFGSAFAIYLVADTGDHYTANKFGRSEEDI